MISDFLFRKMTELSNFWKCKSHQDSMNEVYSLLTSEHTLTIITLSTSRIRERTEEEGKRKLGKGRRKGNK